MNTWQEFLTYTLDGADLLLASRPGHFSFEGKIPVYVYEARWNSQSVWMWRREKSCPSENRSAVVQPLLSLY